jgi:molecular chaperone DnaJ
MHLKVSREGEAGINGGPQGDLYVLIHIKENSEFVRNGNDIVYEAGVELTVAVLGGEIEVPTLNGKARLKIPEGTQTGKIFRLAGKGLPSLDHHGQGDELVQVNVTIPTDLTKKERELLEEFSKERQNHKKKGFFG